MLRNLFTRRDDGRDISQAARAMRQRGIDKDTARIRARVDEMRAEQGKPAWEWRT